MKKNKLFYNKLKINQLLTIPSCVRVYTGTFIAKRALAQGVTIDKIWKLEKLVLYLIKFKQQLNNTKQQHTNKRKKDVAKVL